MIKEIRIPEISENVTSGKVVEVLVQPGDRVAVDEPLIEFETEKAVVEIPSPYAGLIEEVRARAGDEMRVGDVIATIEVAGEGESPAEGEPPAGEETPPEAGEEAAEETAAGSPREEADETSAEARREGAAGDRSGEAPAPEEPEARGGRGEAAGGDEPARADRPARKARPEEPAEADRRGPAPASPSVRRFARELGVDIHAVTPAAPGDRLSEADVRAHVKKALAGEGAPRTADSGGAAGETPELPDLGRWGEVETLELSTVRRLTAEHLAASWRVVPQVTQFERADVTGVEAFLERHAAGVAEAGGKLTVTAVMVKVCAAALRRFPRFNAAIDPARRRLVQRRYVHIGIAVDTPRGLLVPVVRDADRKSIRELAVEVVDLARRAREKKLAPDAMEGGGFTISNQGGIGGTGFTPLVFWPQAAILGVSRAETRPRYVDGALQPRRVLPLALSYDHRIVDGADAARFLGWVREALEHPLTLHLD